MNSLTSIGIPVFGLMVLAYALPYLWARILPEGIPGLIANFALSAAVLSLVVFGYFFLFYAEQQGPQFADLLQQPGAFTPYFLKWAGKTSLVWLPLLVLGTAAQPKRWKEVVW